MVIPHGRIDYDDQRTHNKGYQAFKITIFKDLNHGDHQKNRQIWSQCLCSPAKSPPTRTPTSRPSIRIARSSSHILACFDKIRIFCLFALFYILFELLYFLFLFTFFIQNRFWSIGCFDLFGTISLVNWLWSSCSPEKFIFWETSWRFKLSWPVWSAKRM